VNIVATNDIGTGVDADELVSGAVIVTIPTDPAAAPTRNEDETDTTQVTVDLVEVADSDTGGSDITSYVVYWDQGELGANWYELSGDSSPNLETTVTSDSGIVSGDSY
jgi:hypothetical protein